LLFLYTDGVTEGKDLSGEMYGKKRVRKKVESALEGGPDAVIRSLVDDFTAHNQGKAFDDDVTLAVVKFLRSSGSAGAPSP
jgi:serine phosphatase RsbU (regulator of sigma subunit)